MRQLTCMSVTVMASLFFSLNLAQAEESNRNQVRSNLSQGWTVVWGKNFTEGDWYRGTKAIAESIASENPGPFMAWFGQTLNENLNKLERNAKIAGRRDLERWIMQSLKSKKIIRYKNFRIEAGFATYNRWNRVVYHEPRTRKTRIKLPFGGWTDGFETYSHRVEKRIPLPNWHQFYIRYQLVAGQPKPNVLKPVQKSIRYTIWNSTRETIRFRLPSGRSYSLSPGQRGRYRNTGTAAQLKVYVFNSGKTYSLSGGDHKFWWMKSQGRVGFDRNYRQ